MSPLRLAVLAALALVACRPLPAAPAPEIDAVTAALDEACTKRGLSSCLDAGRRYEQGIDSAGRDGPAPSSHVVQRAILTYHRGCVMGQAEACARLADFVVQHPNALEAHRRRLAAAIEHACGTRHPRHPASCVSAALHARACDLGRGASCGALADLRDGGALDRGGLGAASSSMFHGVACGRGWSASCERVAEILLEGGVHRRRDPARAATLLARACEAGTVHACLLLAERYARGDGAPLDMPRARDLRARACEAGLGAACHALAEMERRGLGGELRSGAAMAHLRRACELGSAVACEDLGRATEFGDGVAEDKPRAFDLYRRSADLYEAGCERGDQRACAALGRLLRHGSGGPSDEARGRAMQRAACEAGEARGCLGVMMRGRFFLPGKERVVGGEALGRSCRSGDAEACYVLARIGPRALLFAPVSTVEGLFDRACALGHPAACNAAGVARFPPDEAGRRQLERGCRMGDALACHHLGLVVERPGAAQDVDLSASLYRRACRWGYAPACTRLGVLRSGGGATGANPDAATTLFARACELGDARGCRELGAMRVRGARVAQNLEEGRRLLERACRMGDASACGLLGSFLLRGRHLDQDRPAGEDLLARACSREDPRSCALLAELLRQGDLVGRDEARAAALLEGAAPAAMSACTRGLRGCYETRGAAGGTVWTTFGGWPVRALVGVSPCDAALERVCQDASDVALARCEHGGRGCFEAADLLDSMIEVGLAGSRLARTQALDRGVKLARERCERGDAASCQRVADAYRQGRGVPRDDGRAGRYRDRACRLEPARCPQDVTAPRAGAEGRLRDRR